MSYHTVLISGVGIAGPTLAFWLRRGGFEPTLLECAPGLRSGGYVIDFCDIAERMGLADAIERVGYQFARNLMVKVSAVPGLARTALGRDIIDKLPLPDYRWP